MMLQRGENAELPPVLLIQGTADESLPKGMIQEVDQRYRAAGGESDLALFEGMPHGIAGWSAPRGGADARAHQKLHRKASWREGQRVVDRPAFGTAAVFAAFQRSGATRKSASSLVRKRRIPPQTQMRRCFDSVAALGYALDEWREHALADPRRLEGAGPLWPTSRTGKITPIIKFTVI